MCPMKYLLFCFLIISGGLFSHVALADEVSYEDSWKFLYKFPLSWQDGRLAFTGSYRISTGDPSVLAPGDWSLEILDGSGSSLQRYYFDPAGMASAGLISLSVPTEGRGVTAQIRDGAGSVLDTEDIAGSRQCNDDGVCEQLAGERNSNCPTDCGSVAAVAGTQTAAIAQQSSLGEKAGAILLRVSFGMVGLMLLVGTARMLDSRRRP
jgi:hypothetical protein